MSKLLVANWKMNCNLNDAISLAGGVNSYIEVHKISARIVICPSFPHIATLQNKFPLTYGAQNCAFASNGAYTGEVSAEMLADIGCRYVIIGHSERRQFFNDEIHLKQKIEQANKNNLKVIFCVGESLNDYKSGKSMEVIERQLSILGDVSGLVVAYEPVWAIGTGLVPKNSEIEGVASYIKSTFEKEVEVLYGGSVNSSNIETLNKIINLDGYLVGGASLSLEHFIKIAGLYQFP